ncbi:hypothetical protein [Candidatus Phyllobacterium onerii]|uniref:hypothetical protein n=1 Tax=Candidatus Phyllobacterium onerii TaxID=3020828 RepID=UPI00232C7609|nr:hypothetical protein [Phyllobacterium sp. IY22]
MHQSPTDSPAYHKLLWQIRANDSRLRTPKRGCSAAQAKQDHLLLQQKQDFLYKQLEFLDELDLFLKFDPDQPRVPPGNSDGGQWTNGQGGIDPITAGATLAHSSSSPQSGSWIKRTEQLGLQIDRETPLRAIVRNNPVIRSATALLSFLKAPELEYPLADAVAQYNAIAAADDPYVVPILSLRARQFSKGDSDTKIWASVRKADMDTVSKFCPRYWTIQTIADSVASTMGPIGSYGTPQNYGTQFHLRAANMVNGLGDSTLKAELFLMAPLAGTPSDYYRQEVGIREKGSLGLDVHETVRNDLTCIYDFKTGIKELDLARMGVFAHSTAKTFPKTEEFFVIQIKPSAGSIRR